jgi:hypothetical protein
VAEDTTLSLLELAQSKSKTRGPECTVTVRMRDHPEHATQIQELIDATPTPIQYSTAADTFQEVGIDLKPDTISRHRRGKCACVAS